MNNFIVLLSLLLIGLKLVGVEPVADWSWVIVLLPVYTGIVAAIVGFITTLITAALTRSNAAAIIAGLTATWGSFILVPLGVILLA